MFNLFYWLSAEIKTIYGIRKYASYADEAFAVTTGTVWGGGGTATPTTLLATHLHPLIWDRPVARTIAFILHSCQFNLWFMSW